MGTSKIQPQEEDNIPDKSVSVCMDLLRVGEGDDPLMGSEDEETQHGADDKSDHGHGPSAGS